MVVVDGCGFGNGAATAAVVVASAEAIATETATPYIGLAAGVAALGHILQNVACMCKILHVWSIQSNIFAFPSM